MKVVMTLLLSLCVAANAATVYLKEDVTTKEAKLIGGMPYNQVGDKVEITGFLKGKVLYGTKNLSLKIAEITDMKAVTKIDKSQVKLVATVDADAVSEDAYDAWEAKEELFLEKCSQCHAAPDAPHHTMLEWEGLYLSMKGFAQPTPKEEVVILQYLKAFAKDGVIKEEL